MQQTWNGTAAGPLLASTLDALAGYLTFIIPFAAALIALYALADVPKNVFRKLLHVAAFTSSLYVALTGPGWLPDALALLLFATHVYPILRIAERWPAFSQLFVEKAPGEIRSSLLLLFVSQAALLAFALGVLHSPYVLFASTTAWGLGDIAAAWVGRPYGRHKIRLPFADPAKSWEGSAAMAVVAFAACLCSLLALSPFGLGRALATSAVVGLVSSFAELSSKKGLDTVTVPVANALVLALLA